MVKYACINCGNFIVKGAANSPYMCRDCEELLEGAEFADRTNQIVNLY